MPSVRRCLLAATTVLALAAPTAEAATRMVATVTPEPPQFSLAGDIPHVRVSCAAEDVKAIRTSVRCWLGTGLTASSTQNLPFAAASVRGYSRWTFTLCAEATFNYGGYSDSTGVKCVSGTNGFASLTG